MNECYMCGITDEKALLYEGIDKKHGFVNVCRKCYFRNKIPLVERKDFAPETEEKRETVRERLSKLAHVRVEKREEKKFSPNLEDVHLKDLVEKNFKKEVSIGTKAPTDLIDNFHWVIMRKRRAMKISKEKLAEEVKEPLIAIESLEKGVLPRDYKSLIKKIEHYLGIRILKDRSIDSNDIINESKIPSGILIEEVKRAASKEKEGYLDASDLDLDKVNDLYGVPEKIPEKEKPIDKPREKPVKKEDLSDEDISKLIWGK